MSFKIKSLEELQRITGNKVGPIKVVIPETYSEKEKIVHLIGTELDGTYSKKYLCVKKEEGNKFNGELMLYDTSSGEINPLSPSDPEFNLVIGGNN